MIGETTSRRSAKKKPWIANINAVLWLGLALVFSCGIFWNRHDMENIIFPCSPSNMVDTFDTASSAPSNSLTTNTTNTAFADLIHSYIVGPDDPNTGCEVVPSHCGCPKSRMECPQWYSLTAIQQSAALQDPDTLSRYALALQQAQQTAQAACDAQTKQQQQQVASTGPNGVAVAMVVQTTGGWCLLPERRPKPNYNQLPVTFPHLGISYPMAVQHVGASRRLVMELVDWIRTEPVTSLNDFGAGIAQYKAAILAEIPDFDYRAYDGAGNGPEYTHGMMNYIDLTLPVHVPVTDWVLSLEVGEHIPSQYEGMLIRNLHRHNRKGIILSWSIIGQDGHSHVNNHSNEYLIRVFQGLGYTYDEALSNKMRNPKDNYWWFQKSVMVFRRKQQQQ